MYIQETNCLHMKRKLQRGTAVFEKMSSMKAVRRPFTGFSEAHGRFRKTGKRAPNGPSYSSSKAEKRPLSRYIAKSRTIDGRNDTYELVCI